MIQTLHKVKCNESAKKARKAMQNTVRKTHKKQEAARKKLRKKTWGF